MRTPKPIVLTGRHVTLEPLAERHVTDLYEAAQDPEVWRWLPVPAPRSVEDVREILATHRGLPWAVVVDGRAAGSTAYLDVDLSVAGLEIGWTWYRRDLWATAVNPECKLLLLDHAFDTLGAQRVTLKTDAQNLRSRAAIGNIGCRYDGTLRHHRRRPDGTVRDTAYFSLLAEEWPAARAGLLDRLGRLKRSV